MKTRLTIKQHADGSSWVYRGGDAIYCLKKAGKIDWLQRRKDDLVRAVYRELTDALIAYAAGDPFQGTIHAARMAMAAQQINDLQSEEKTDGTK